MFVARSKKFAKQYQKLPKKVQQQFKKRLLLYLEDVNHPLLRVHSLVGAYKDAFSLNVTADIRAVFKIKDSDTIYFIVIGSHSELYE